MFASLGQNFHPLECKLPWNSIFHAMCFHLLYREAFQFSLDSFIQTFGQLKIYSTDKLPFKVFTVGCTSRTGSTIGFQALQMSILCAPLLSIYILWDGVENLDNDTLKLGGLSLHSSREQGLYVCGLSTQPLTRGC